MSRARGRNGVACLCVFAIALVFHYAPAMAQAPNPILVNPSQSAEILRLQGKTITEERTTSGGTVLKGVQPTTPPTTVLVYVAPPNMAQGDDTVTYKADGTASSIPIQIRPAAPSLQDGAFYTTSFKALFALLILAVLIESGLALIFHWKPFLIYFDSKTVNALVAFAFSLLLVYLFKLDIVTTLINIYSAPNLPQPANWAGRILTAMIIAGGSAGVNRLFQSLGFRPVSAVEQAQPKPAPTEAWIAVSLVRDKAEGPVNVLIGPTGALALAGTISGSGRKGARGSWWRYFLRDQGRFPPSGGHSVAPGGPYEVRLVGWNKDIEIQTKTWGPYPVAAGAIVDIEMVV
jgi:hypothetical protein